MTTGNRSQSEPKGSYWKAHLGDWAKYTAAAGAALSMATGADAGIVSGTPGKTISTPSSHLNGLGGSPGGTRQATTFGLFGAEIALSNNSVYTHAGGKTFRSVRAAVQGVNVFFQSRASFLQAATNGQHGFALKFNSGQSITGGFGKVPDGVLRDRQFFSARGRFGFNTTGIVGFTVLGGDLGWMKVKVGDGNSDGYPDQLKVISWAYNTTPGAAITAGEAPAASPEPGTAALGLLAAGAAGILALRRRRKEVQSN